MTAMIHAPRSCDAEDRLKRAAFAFTNMLGDGRFDLGELRKLLAPAECEDHKPAGAERGTVSPALAASPYRPPFTGRA